MSGIGLALTVLFAILKAVGVVAWGWLLVLAPVLIGIGFDIVIFVAMVALQATAISSVRKDFRR